MKQKLKPQYVYFDIKRVNEDARTIEAYAFVNEVVDGEGGIRLKRSAMEAATPDYMQWANVRRMHQADAVGVAQSVDWDQTGARMTLEVVDEDAWQKVKRGVYKGLSVGVAATIMRGKDVEACKWYETSLVDRPKDPDARILALRAEDVQDDPEFECDVEEVQRGDSPPDFASMMGATQLGEEGWEALDALYSVLCQIALSDADDKEALARASVQQFADYIAQMVTGGKVKARAANPDLTRLAGLETANQQLLTRAEAAESDLAIARADLAAAKERVVRLEAMPSVTPPVRYYQGVERTFRAGEQDPAVQPLIDEYRRLQVELPTKPESERLAGIQRMQVIRMELAGQGVTSI